MSSKIVLPIWLNKSFLEKSIRSYKNDKTLEILSYETEEGFKDHYGSKLFCLKIFFKPTKSPEDELKVVIKTETDDTVPMGGMMKNSPLIETEVKIYKKIFPLINDLLNRHGMKCEFTPEFIFAELEPHPVLVIKNMRDEGFDATLKPVKDLDGLKIIFQRLAQFHAASYHLADDFAEDFEQFSNNLFQNREFVDFAYGKRIRILKNVVATWKGYEDYVPRLEYAAQNASEIGQKCYVKNKPETGYNVLNHANLHAKNLLTKFNKNSNQLEDFRFIDFQESSYCSPAIDFSYFFTMVEGGVFDDDNELISYYHKEFKKTLKQFGHLKSIPSLLDLKVELLRNSTGSMLIQMIYIPAFFFDQVSDDDIIASNDVEKRLLHKIKIFNHPECKKLIQRSLKSWLQKGYLEVKCE